MKKFKEYSHSFKNKITCQSARSAIQLTRKFISLIINKHQTKKNTTLEEIKN